MLVVEFPGSGDSHLQVCSRRPAEELIESADPPSQKEPSDDSHFRRQLFEPGMMGEAMVMVLFTIMVP